MKEKIIVNIFFCILIQNTHFHTLCTARSISPFQCCHQTILSLTLCLTPLYHVQQTLTNSFSKRTISSLPEHSNRNNPLTLSTSLYDLVTICPSHEYSQPMCIHYSHIHSYLLYKSPINTTDKYN